MKKLHVFGASLVSGVVLATAVATPVAAWHPVGKIKKSVQNVTTGGQLSDANTANEAVEAKPGDTLKYVIEISNAGKADSRGYNDMYFTKLQDTLPEGVELVSDSAKREITENLGVIKPGQKVTKEYTVKVVSETDEDFITNKACFTGDSEVKDQPQKGCDEAVVTVDVPQVPVEEEPKQDGKGGADTPEVKAVTTLPETGFGTTAGLFTTVSGLGYAAHRVVSRKRQ